MQKKDTLIPTNNSSVDWETPFYEWRTRAASLSTIEQARASRLPTNHLRNHLGTTEYRPSENAVETIQLRTNKKKQTNQKAGQHRCDTIRDNIGQNEISKLQKLVDFSTIGWSFSARSEERKLWANAASHCFIQRKWSIQTGVPLRMQDSMTATLWFLYIIIVLILLLLPLLMIITMMMMMIVNLFTSFQQQ